MARKDFEKLEDAIEYITENEQKIDEYDNLNTTFENYKNTTEKEKKITETEIDKLQKANMSLYLKSIDENINDNSNDNDNENKDDKISLDDFALDI